MIVILNRIREKFDQRLKKEQAGFRKNCSCVDLINTLRIIIEQSNELNKRIYLVFTDFEKAFDSVSRDKIWKIMERFGLPQKILKLIQETYRNYTCQIMHKGKLTESTEIISGVRQGCVLSPLFFVGYR
jgi:galactokinase/mevalonate kinase-like predicted kinase